MMQVCCHDGIVIANKADNRVILTSGGNVLWLRQTVPYLPHVLHRAL